MTGRWYESVVSFPGEIRGGPVDVYCRVALSDLTSAVEERCHGGQTHWDVCVSFFFFFPWTNLAHAKKGLCNCQDYSFGLLYIISQILQMVSCSRQIWDNYQGYNKTQGTTQSVPTIQVLLVTCSCMNFSVSLTTGVTDEAPLTSLRIRFSPPLLVPRGENIV